jgi:hypothetical protein
MIGISIAEFLVKEAGFRRCHNIAQVVEITLVLFHK